MSERKVLNKYYPPDFDPSKIPKLKQNRTKQYTIRTMAPFNMRCNTCADYIYKGRKFNAKCEVAEGENFLGLRIYRFYIRCPKCITEIMFKTDPENTDYTLEKGATRLFEAAKLIEEAERREQKQREEDATNPMKMLETRTKDSKLEMDIMENLEDLREINTRKDEVDYTEVLKRKAEEQQERLLRQEQEDEDEIKRIFGRAGEGSLKRLQNDSDSGEEESPPPLKKPTSASDVLVEGNVPRKTGDSGKTSRKQISSMIKRKRPATPAASESPSGAEGGTPPKRPPATGDQGPSTSTQDPSTQGPAPPVELGSGTSRSAPPAGNGAEDETVDDGGSGGGTGETGETEEGTQRGPEAENEAALFDSIQEGLANKMDTSTKKAREERKAPSFGLLVGYEGSDSDTSSGSE